jgi:hypothetical protein
MSLVAGSRMNAVEARDMGVVIPVNILGVSLGVL